MDILPQEASTTLIAMNYWVVGKIVYLPYTNLSQDGWIGNISILAVAVVILVRLTLQIGMIILDLINGITLIQTVASASTIQ